MSSLASLSTFFYTVWKNSKSTIGPELAAASGIQNSQMLPKQGTNLKFLNSQMLCDLVSDGAKVYRFIILPTLRTVAWMILLLRAWSNRWCGLGWRCARLLWKMTSRTLTQTILPIILTEAFTCPRIIQIRILISKCLRYQVLTSNIQYNIRQVALKHAVNSMYRCLGFEYSRFYTWPLAALTTFKGHKIVMHTRELAENLSLDMSGHPSQFSLVYPNLFDRSSMATWTQFLLTPMSPTYLKLSGCRTTSWFQEIGE
jgi:hypothetical protein